MTTGPRSDELNECFAAANAAADGASQILLNYFGNLHSVDEKFQAGLVSEADRESEAFISNLLKKSFPQHDFLGEETGLNSDLAPKTFREKVSSSGSLWIIDPLDGTTNYVHRFPVFAVSIGLQVAGQLVLGVIDAPKMGLRYTAVRGQGAFCNGQPIRVSHRTEFREGLFATGFSSADDDFSDHFRLIESCVREARGIRRAGAAALDLCFVAQGIFDVFWERFLSPWDTAAGVVIASEAGAAVTNYLGEPYEAWHSDVLAGSPALHSQVLSRLKSVQMKRGSHR